MFLLGFDVFLCPLLQECYIWTTLDLEKSYPFVSLFKCAHLTVLLAPTAHEVNIYTVYGGLYTPNLNLNFLRSFEMKFTLPYL